MTAKATARKHHPHLDGIRGICVLIVVLYHLGFGVARNGWLCISAFFSLSGFLITGISVEAYERERQVNLLRFWARRVGRLLPALLAVVLLAAMVAWFTNQTDDETAVWFLKWDFLTAIFYMENINAVYVRGDNYFAAYMKPSPMRHVWTLSIEEQYYFAWPFILWFCVRFFARRQEEEENAKDQEGQMPPDSDEKGLPQPDWCLLRALAICLGLVIVCSYISSHATVASMGLSAAYYSTWSRAGDFACGGLVYVLLRYLPSVTRRYSSSPDDNLPAMSAGYRLVLELLFALDILLLILPPMIQKPIEVVLPFYFTYFRIPFGFFIIVLSVPGALQASQEPLPAWALVSRVMRSWVVRMMGTISYGVYLIHWPLILWLSQPVDHAKFDAADTATTHAADSEQPQAGTPSMATDVMLVSLSFGIGYASYWFYEKPIMDFAAKCKQPLQVIAAGGAAMLLCAGVVLVLYKGAVKPEEEKTDFDSVPEADVGEAGRLQRIEAKLDGLMQTMQELTTAIAEKKNLSADHLKALAMPTLPSIASNALTIAIMGESVGNRLANQIRTTLGKCKKQVTLTGGQQVNMLNFAKEGCISTLYFIPCQQTKLCGAHKYGKNIWNHTAGELTLKKGIATRRPDVLVVKDVNWPSAASPSGRSKNTLPQAIVALRNLLLHSFSSGVKHFFFMTNSPFQPGPTAIHQDLVLKRQTFQHLKCRPGETGMTASILKWHLLVCPNFNETGYRGPRFNESTNKCPREAHGFKSILPDKRHPSSQAGVWLGAQLLAAILAGVGRATGVIQDHANLESIPAVQHCLWKAQKPDSTQSLWDLLETFSICPKPEPSKLAKKLAEKQPKKPAKKPATAAAKPGITAPKPAEADPKPVKGT